MRLTKMDEESESMWIEREREEGSQAILSGRYTHEQECKTVKEVAANVRSSVNVADATKQAVVLLV